MSSINLASVGGLPLSSQAAGLNVQDDNQEKQTVDIDSSKTVGFAQPKTEISRSELDEAIDVLNTAAVIESRSLSFSIDDLSGREVIKVVDLKSSEVLRQIPSEELLKVAQDIRRLQDEMGQTIGLLVDNKV
ncbi:flagellar protein FlaG [Alkalimonas collagenimarina]|uniref:Flagellar protein FlaG n=1 Tax=Alkalimonas collagenimarina TaxID=400390 RepID=A0ABT9GXV4_9GAMM|nr:flagellar protein FlaG [Alkalimonas collagenimarina]MDP4535889.1 flagellar protein FlaG [Alkalimonas collagenimarina]